VTYLWISPRKQECPKNSTRAGLLGADELAAREQDRHKDKVADINFQVLAAAHGHPRRCIHCTQLPRTLHPHAPVVLAAVEEGAAVHDLEQEKLAKYVPVSARTSSYYEVLDCMPLDIGAHNS